MSTSFYEDASLVMIPSGYKTSKVYSAKPTDGAGDLVFSRSNDTATRVGPDGLIEKVRTNLLTYSQDLTNAVWSKFTYSGGAVTVTGSQSDPFGGTNAQKVDITIGTGGVLITQNITVDATAQYGLSVWLKGAVGGEKVEFDLRDTASNGVAGPVQTLTTTWTRYTITLTNNGGTSRGLQFRITTLQGASDCTFFAYGAQLEAGVPTDYIPTTSAAVSVGPVSGLPRLDYLNSSCPRLLLEPQRTNLATYSEQFDNAVFVKTNNTITANATTSPDGYTNADKVIPTTTNGFHSLDILPSVIVTTYTLSVFAKAGEYSKIALLTNNRGSNMARGFDLNNGTTFANDFGYSEPTSFSIKNYGNGWYRCSITYPKTSTGTSGNGVAVINDAGASTFAGNGTDGLFLYGFQMESGASYVSSYIPTLGAAVTRGADDASKTGISSLIGQTEGTVFVEVDYSTLSGLDMFLSIRPNASNKVEVYRDGGTIYGEITASGSFALSASKAVGTHKIAFAYKSGSTALYIDGVLAGQSTTAFTYSATLADLFINQRSGGTFIEAANYKQALLFKTRLPNSELAALTAL